MRKYLSEKMLEAEVKMMLAGIRMKNRVKELVRDERGDTNFVAIIVIIVIILLIAGIFRDKLKDAVVKVMDNLNNFIDEK
ncbi:MAG: hypothetical protein HDR28_08825 [Lachnospiraceae bacterium]|nr:hypothetical protein [Lachnospiraceae bacterium]